MISGRRPVASALALAFAFGAFGALGAPSASAQEGDGREEPPPSMTAPGTNTGVKPSEAPSPPSPSPEDVDPRTDPEPAPTEPSEPSEPPTLVQSGSATPTPIVDGDIENVPNLTDLELAVARLTVSSERTQANISLAPFLIPGHYKVVLSELRLGVSADSLGAFGVGMSLGYNQPRHRLTEYALDPAFCEPKQRTTAGPDVQSLDAEIENMLGDLCALAAAACAGAEDAACRGAVRECAQAAPADTPAVFRLLKLIRRLEALKDPGAPPSPPRAPDAGAKEDPAYFAALTEYMNKSATYQGRRAAFTAVRLSLPIARALRERREAVGEQSDLAREQGLVSARQLCRLKAAYRMSQLVNVSASVSFFPLYFGPRITRVDGAETELANEHYLRRFDAALAYRLYVSRLAAVQIRGGVRTERGDTSEDSPLLTRGLVGADLGFFAPLSEGPDENGFQRGVGFGLSGTAWFCGASGGCETSIGLSSPYAPGSGVLPLSRRIQVAGFVEWRQAAALQIRAGVEARMDSVVGALPEGSGAGSSPMLTRVIPTLGIGSSFWGI
jgi:hypothetical protein